MRTPRLIDLAELNPSVPEFDQLDPDTVVSFLPMEQVWPDTEVLGEVRKAAVENGYTRFIDGDLLLPKITPTFSHGRSMLVNGLIGGVGAGTTELHVLRARPGVCSRWLFYMTKSERFLQEGEGTLYGVAGQKRISTKWLHDFEVDEIPYDDQVRCAFRLDQECADVDKLVAEQAHQRALLEERRAALITSALSGAYSADATFVESGVSWIGKVPSHWEVKRLKHVGRSLIGLTYQPADVVPEGEAGLLVLRSGNIQDGRILLEDNVYVRTIVPPHLLTREGDILICARNGSARLIGKCSVLGKDAVGMTWGAFMTVYRSQMNPYLAWVFRSSIFSQQLGLFATSTINQLTNTTLHNFYVPIPPEDERASIVARLDGECGKIDDLIDELNRSEQLLAERKRAVITAVVTGKMEVA